MKMDYKNIIPRRYHNASYENDVNDIVKEIFIEEIKKRNGLYIYGKSGCGKTHLACALIKHILEKGFDVIFYNTGDFLEMLRDEYDRPPTNEDSLFRKIMDFKGVLVFDDLGSENISNWARERLYLIINKKYYF